MHLLARVSWLRRIFFQGLGCYGTYPKTELSELHLTGLQGSCSVGILGKKQSTWHDEHDLITSADVQMMACKCHQLKTGPADVVSSV